MPRRPLARRHYAESDELSRAILAYARRRSAELGLTVEELAHRTGVTSRCLRTLSRGGAPTLATLLGLAHTLGMPVEAMIAEARRVR